MVYILYSLNLKQLLLVIATPTDAHVSTRNSNISCYCCSVENQRNSTKDQSKQVNIAKMTASFFLLISELCSNLSWFK